MAAGLVIIVRRRGTRGDLPALLDAAILATGTAVVAGVFVIAPIAGDSSLTFLGKLTSSVYPIGDVLLLGILARLWTTPGARTTAFKLLAGAFALTLVGDALYNYTALQGGNVTCLLVNDLMWLGAYVLLAGAAWSPSVRDARRTGSRGARTSPTRPSGWPSSPAACCCRRSPCSATPRRRGRLRGADRHGLDRAVGPGPGAGWRGCSRWCARRPSSWPPWPGRTTLTGIPNRRSLDYELSRACQTARDQRHDADGGDPRPRPLQAVQRHLRPPRRRPPAPRGHRGLERPPHRGRDPGQVRRRGVRRPLPRPDRDPGPGAGARAAARHARRPDVLGGGRHLGAGQRSQLGALRRRHRHVQREEPGPQPGVHGHRGRHPRPRRRARDRPPADRRPRHAGADRARGAEPLPRRRPRDGVRGGPHGRDVDGARGGGDHRRPGGPPSGADALGQREPGRARHGTRARRAERRPDRGDPGDHRAHRHRDHVLARRRGRELARPRRDHRGRRLGQGLLEPGPGAAAPPPDRQDRHVPGAQPRPRLPPRGHPDGVHLGRARRGPDLRRGRRDRGAVARAPGLGVHLGQGWFFGAPAAPGPAAPAASSPGRPSTLDPSGARSKPGGAVAEAVVTIDRMSDLKIALVHAGAREERAVTTGTKAWEPFKDDAGRHRGAGERRAQGPVLRAPGRRRGRGRRDRQRRRPRHPAALDRARDGAGGPGPVPGRPARDRPADPRRLLLRLRRRDPVRARGPREDRDPDAQDHQGGPAVLPAGHHRRRRAQRAQGRALQGRADRA